MLLWLLYPVLAASASVNCPLFFDCEGLDAGVCFQVDQTQVSINNSPCTDLYASCQFRDITDYYQTVHGTNDVITVNCTEGRNVYPFTNVTSMMLDFCANKASYKAQRLKNGQPLYKCSSDSDCELNDGSYGNCTCTNLVSKSFCELNYGDDIISPIYNAACNNNTRMFKYYYAFRMAYLSSINTLSCSDTIFENIVYAGQIIQVGITDSAASLLNQAVAVGLGLVVLGLS